MTGPLPSLHKARRKLRTGKPCATVKGQPLNGGQEMLYWAIVCLVIAVIAGILGFGGIAGTAASFAKILFFVFLVLLVVSLVVNALRGKGPKV